MGVNFVFQVQIYMHMQAQSNVSSDRRNLTGNKSSDLFSGQQGGFIRTGHYYLNLIFPTMSLSRRLNLRELLNPDV